jgi:hypothetical protein
MLFHSIRKYLLIGAAILALAIPAVASADQSSEDCSFLEMNIPEYNCDQTLAEWAAVDDDAFPAPPPGVDFLFWEMNVYEMESGDADYSWIPTPSEPVEEVDDVSFPMEGFAAY